LINISIKSPSEVITMCQWSSELITWPSVVCLTYLGRRKFDSSDRWRSACRTPSNWRNLKYNSTTHALVITRSHVDVISAISSLEMIPILRWHCRNPC